MWDAWSRLIQRRATSQPDRVAEEAHPRGIEFMRGSLRLRIIVAVAVLALAAEEAIGLAARHPPDPCFAQGLSGRETSWRRSRPRHGRTQEVVDVGRKCPGNFSSSQGREWQAIDYGSVVKSNMLLARIDTNLFQADVDWTPRWWLRTRRGSAGRRQCETDGSDRGAGGSGLETGADARAVGSAGADHV